MPIDDADFEVLMQDIKAHMQHFTAFQKRETDICPNCDKAVTALEQIGRCVYAEPCGCRLWQGTIPEAWLESEAGGG